MSLRFTNNTLRDALAMFQLSQQGINAYQQGQAGRAYRDAQQQLETEQFSGEDAAAQARQAHQEALRLAEERAVRQAQMGNVGLADPSPVEGRGLSPEEARRQARAEVDAQYAPVFASVDAQRNRPAGRIYSIGTGDAYQEGSEPFSRDQRRRAGLRAAADTLYGYGRTEEGGRTEAQAMALRRGELELSEAERKDRIRRRLDDVGKTYSDPKASLKRLEQLYNADMGPFGSGEHAGRTARAFPTADGGATVKFFDDKDNLVKEQTFNAAEVRNLSMRNALIDMALADPTNTDLLMKLQKMGVEEKELQGRMELWSAQGQHWKDQAPVISAQAGLYAEHGRMYGNQARDLSQYRRETDQVEAARRSGKIDDKEYTKQIQMINQRYFGDRAGGAGSRGGPLNAMTMGDFLKIREDVQTSMMSEPGFSKLSPAEKQKRINDETLKRVHEFNAIFNEGGYNVKGVSGVGGGLQGGPRQGGGEAALSRVPAQAGPAPRARGGRSDLPERMVEARGLVMHINDDDELFRIARTQPETPLGQAAREKLDERTYSRRMGLGEIFGLGSR